MDYQALKAEVKAAGYVTSEGDTWTLVDQNSYTQYMHFNKGVRHDHASYRLAFKQFVGEAFTTVEHVLEEGVEKVEDLLGLEGKPEGDDQSQVQAQQPVVNTESTSSDQAPAGTDQSADQSNQDASQAAQDANAGEGQAEPTEQQAAGAEETQATSPAGDAPAPQAEGTAGETEQAAQ